MIVAGKAVHDPELSIGPYELRTACCRPWDARAPEVAARVAALIRTVLPVARVEHIGSTSVPGCGGKGIVDLLLLYPPGGLAAARDALASLGFQRQPGRDPWPEERPMRVGSVVHDDDRFALHVHVVASGSAEEAWDVGFRDRLRADPALVEAYVARKREIIGDGVVDSVDYSRAKGPFIEGVIGSTAPGKA
jgi:GrpB-like predicted nucleotidyltransferase (UPF0157 family)